MSDYATMILGEDYTSKDLTSWKTINVLFGESIYAKTKHFDEYDWKIVFEGFTIEVLDKRPKYLIKCPAMDWTLRVQSESLGTKLLQAQAKFKRRNNVSSESSLEDLLFL